MKRQLLGVALLLSFFGAFTLMNPVAAEDKKDEKTKADDKVLVVETKAAKTTPATAIDFNHELGLQFEALVKLGGCIEEARKNGDPVSLATAATCLSASETASGKKAKLTAEELFKEAVKMAKARDISTELKAVAALTKGHEVSKELSTMAEAAEKKEADRIAKFKSGEKSRGLIGRLTVRNETPYRLYISVNFVEIGWVGPYTEYQFSKEYSDRGVATFLYAQNAGGDITASNVITTDRYDVSWTLSIK
jgi:hypothetical protein